MSKFWVPAPRNVFTPNVAEGVVRRGKSPRVEPQTGVGIAQDRVARLVGAVKSHSAVFAPLLVPAEVGGGAVIGSERPAALERCDSRQLPVPEKCGG